MACVTVLAATGQVGRALIPLLKAGGYEVIAVGRNPAKLATLPPCIQLRIADFTDRKALAAALCDATYAVNCANAVHVPAILAALPPAGIERLVVMGSTRRYSVLPDETAAAVKAAEFALAAYPRPSVMLLATLIYGGGRGVVEWLRRFTRWCPVLPLPGGGRAKVQPIHIDDVAASLAAALISHDAPGTPIVIAGPVALSFGDMARAVARAWRRPLCILPMPGSPAEAVGEHPRMPTLMRCFGAGLARLLEDRSFDIAEMRRRLRVEPRAFAPR